MSEVIGPTSTMPGHSHDLPKGTKCDLHPRRKAVARIQGETDSMGAELNDFCQQCFDEYRECMRNVDTSGVCDWCKKPADKRRETRDYDEGMAGPIYMVCLPCRKRRDDEALAELSDYYDGWPDDGDNE